MDETTPEHNELIRRSEVDIEPGTAVEVPDEWLEEPRTEEQIRMSIEAARHQISRSLDTLRDEVHETFDWKSYVRRRPLACVGGAFALGVFIAWSD